MELVFWWLSLLSVAGLVVAWIVVHRLTQKRGKKATETRSPLANSHRLRRLPEYQLMIRRYRLIVYGVLAVGVIGLIMAIILVGRPSQVSVVEPEMRNRDIILCLDVSGSMITADAELTRIYANLAEEFDGERIGLVLFDSSPVTIFPLTNDYEFVKDQLAAVSEYFSITTQDYSSLTDEQKQRMFDLNAMVDSGTRVGGGSSLIGDGLGACVGRFDQIDRKRVRSIVLGTDNYVAGNPIITLPEAAALAKERDIRVYGVNPADFSAGSYTTKETEEFKRAMLLTKGDYYRMDDARAAATIIGKVTAQDATRFKGSPEIHQTDQPQIVIIILMSVIAVMMVASWRLKL